MAQSQGAPIMWGKRSTWQNIAPKLPFLAAPARRVARQLSSVVNWIIKLNPVTETLFVHRERIRPCLPATK